MSKEVSFKNRDRFVQLGIAIAALRKMRGLSQEKLAERAGVSRSLISTIEAPNMAHGFSLDVFFDIADALEEELCAGDTPIPWSRFYDAFYDWKPEYARERLQAVTGFGNDDEVMEVTQELFGDDEYEASRFISRALDEGVRFKRLYIYQNHC